MIFIKYGLVEMLSKCNILIKINVPDPPNQQFKAQCK